MNLRSRVIRLAYHRHDLRPHLLPLLKTAAVEKVENPDAKKPWKAQKPGSDQWAYFNSKEKAQAYAKGKGLKEKVKEKASAIIDKAKSMVEEQKEFFREGGFESGSDQRRKVKEAMKSKGKAAIKALKQEGEKYKDAASSLKSLAKGEEITDKQKKALVGVATSVATTAALTALTGGTGAPMSKVFQLFAKGMARSVLNSSAMKGIIFGSRHAAEEPSDDKVMMQFIEAVADKIETEELTTEQWVELVEEANESSE